MQSKSTTAISEKSNSRKAYDNKFNALAQLLNTAIWVDKNVPAKSKEIYRRTESLEERYSDLNR